METQKLQGRREFAEEFGILFESMGLPCMAGRIWGWLLTSDPPHQTAADIAKGVSASRGSVSTMTNNLMQSGLVDRVGVPGERSKLYRIKSGGFTEILRTRMRFITELRKTLGKGLGFLKDETPEVRRRLEEYLDLCIFFEREFPALIDKWEEERKRTNR
ncbi:MAG: MarR family transcriptional regulator [Candidatus Hydrogenedentota bacterium]|nr:MAG: MarR family transcriptional regulator [Candidatus Hydrogenedentota bacterium]